MLLFRLVMLMFWGVYVVNILCMYVLAVTGLRYLPVAGGVPT